MKNLKNKKIHKIILIRHGESVWNKANRFTGWTDVKLTSNGLKEAEKAGKVLKKENYFVDLAFTNCHIRAKKTLKIILKKLNLKKIPVTVDWRLNERHYGNLQGLSKVETAKKFGQKQFLLWRRSYDIRPPKIETSNITYKKIINNPIYKNIKIPKTECLKDVLNRIIPFWNEEIIPQIKLNKKIIISASGNSLRALLKYLAKIPDSKISDLNIPTGIPMVFEFDKNLKFIKYNYLGNQKEIKKKINKIKNLNKKTK
jgi:2,3-bisphosphoglycerate-dependent phosphoglycerate mutase